MSIYTIEYDHSISLTGLGGKDSKLWGNSIGHSWQTTGITASLGPAGNALVFQTVWENGKLVDSVFDYKRSRFGTQYHSNIFRGFSNDSNFRLLRKMCSLGDKDTEHVTSLISEFHITADGKIIERKVEDGTYKLGLLLYWFAEGKDEFTMNAEKRQFLWDFFGHEITGDAFRNKNTKYPEIQALLQETGVKVKIIRPIKTKQ